jgi:outer membrane protein
MKKSAAVTVLAALGLASGVAMAQQSPWLIRARAVHVNPADKSDPIPALGVPGDAITVSSKTIPEVDISYFFTPNIAAELVLTYPQKHDVSIAGTKIGTVKELPPTLTLQYHFTPDAQFSPYVGAGVNFTHFSSVDLTVPGVGKLDVDRQSWGLALQAGVDFKIDKNWSINFDVKKVQMRTDVLAGGTKVSEVKIDPWLIGVGVGYRF